MPAEFVHSLLFNVAQLPLSKCPIIFLFRLYLQNYIFLPQKNKKKSFSSSFCFPGELLNRFIFNISNVLRMCFIPKRCICEFP